MARGQAGAVIGATGWVVAGLALSGVQEQSRSGNRQRRAELKCANGHHPRFAHLGPSDAAFEEIETFGIRSVGRRVDALLRGVGELGFAKSIPDDLPDYRSTPSTQRLRRLADRLRKSVPAGKG